MGEGTRYSVFDLNRWTVRTPGEGILDLEIILDGSSLWTTTERGPSQSVWGWGVLFGNGNGRESPRGLWTEAEPSPSAPLHGTTFEILEPARRREPTVQGGRR